MKRNPHIHMHTGLSTKNLFLMHESWLSKEVGYDAPSKMSGTLAIRNAVLRHFAFDRLNTVVVTPPQIK